ncbi:hypothetical protein ACR9PT_13845 [Piscirickettsia salmonis]|uniref:hypothetical protein n=1 Tax=Piscirickettsia salmonis TaxID=1238 RepID=UPI003EB945C1
MPNFINIDKTELESKIQEIYNILDPNNEEKHKDFRLNINDAFSALKKICDKPLSEIFMEHYFNQESVSDPTLQIAQCKNILLTQLDAMLNSKKNKDKNKDKVVSIFNYIKLIIREKIAVYFEAASNEFKELYSWDEIKKLDLNKEYFNKILLNPLCFKQATGFGLNQYYIEKSLDNSDFFKKPLEKLISKCNIEISLERLSLEKNKICENMSFSETKLFLQHNGGCIARKSQNHPDKIVFGHIDSEGLIQQHLIDMEDNFWVLKSGPEEQLGTKLGESLIDIAKNNGSFLNFPGTVQKFQNQQSRMHSSFPELFLFDKKKLPNRNFEILSEPGFFYHKSLEKKNGSPGESKCSDQPDVQGAPSVAASQGVQSTR